MNTFANTFKILDQLIAKLQANTGGEIHTTKPVPPVKQSNQKKVQPKKQQQKKEEKAEEKTAVKKQKKQGKKEAKKQQPKKPEQNNNQVDVKLFSQIDIRIGQIVDCWKHPDSQNLYCQKINVCGEVRQIASGLQKFVAIENMKGKVLVMANLKPKPLAGFQSNGMVVCASTLQHDKVELLIPVGQLGQRVYLQGYEDLFKGGDVLPVLNPKRKVVEKCMQHFKTDQEGIVVWKQHKLRTKLGYIKGTIVKGNVG